MMDRLEQDLRDALRREEPPDGFARRVLAAARTEAGRQPRSVWDWFRRPAMQWALVAAACIVLSAGLALERRQRAAQARGEAAKAQLMLALRITRTKLQRVQAEVTRVGSDTLLVAPRAAVEKHL